MLLAGVAPYLFFGDETGGLYFCGGYGMFAGSMWNQDPKIGLENNRNHRGYAAWGTVGISMGWLDIDFKVRYHHFNNIRTHSNDTDVEAEEYLELEHDTVFVLRFTIPIALM